MGRIEEAKQRYEGALIIYGTLLSTDPENVEYQSYVGMTLYNLGNLLSKTGRIEEAKQRYEGALKIRETLLSTDPGNVGYQSDVGMALNNLGILLSDMEKYDDALKLYERALDVIETGMGASNPYFGKIMDNNIRLYEKMARIRVLIKSIMQMIKSIMQIWDCLAWLGNSHTIIYLTGVQRELEMMPQE